MVVEHTVVDTYAAARNSAVVLAECSLSIDFVGYGMVDSGLQRGLVSPVVIEVAEKKCRVVSRRRLGDFGHLDCTW